MATRYSRHMLLRWMFFATLSLVLFLQLLSLDYSLVTTEARWGTLSYELAVTSQRAADILTSWKNSGVTETAKVRLGLDMAFLIAYPLFFRSWITWLYQDSGERIFRIGAPLARAVLLCAPLNLMENLALLRMLDAGASSGLALLATSAAAIKFVLVAAAAVWCAWALSRKLVARPAND